MDKEFKKILEKAQQSVNAALNDGNIFRQKCRLIEEGFSQTERNQLVNYENTIRGKRNF